MNMNDEVRGSATGVRTLSWVVGGTDTDNREKIMACRISFIKGKDGDGNGKT